MPVNSEPRCPECGEPLDYDEVDIGVGVQRGNYHCPACGWHEKPLIEAEDGYGHGV